MIKTVTIIGMGALGLLYGGLLSCAQGACSVRFAADGERVKRYANTRFTINGKECKFYVVSARDASPADLVIVAVKYGSIGGALDVMEKCVGEDTTIISVMNGISGEELIAERYGDSNVLYCVAQGMDAVKLGSALTYSKPGELRIGVRRPEQADRLARLDEFFTAVGVPHKVDADITHTLWAKFMLNVGINQACMVYETNYGGAIAQGRPRNTMIAAMHEVIEIAKAEGVALSEADIDFYVNLIKTLDPEKMPSMRQDGLEKRPSEVELFAGTVKRLGKKHGISTPVNDFLYDRVRDMEAHYA